MNRPIDNRDALKKIQEQVAKKLVEKSGPKKKMETAVEVTFARICRFVFYTSKYDVRRYRQGSRFGCDQLGRDVEDGLRKYVGLLKARELRIHTIVVMGSRAKGTWTPKSDVDVLIVVSNLPKEGTNFLSRRLFGIRRNLLLSDRSLFLGIEPSGCCSRAEFMSRLESLDIQTLDAILYGQVICDDGFWQKANAKYREIESKYKLEHSTLKKMLIAV